MGVEARSTIRISVSVMPRVRVETGASPASPSVAQGFSVSNMPGLRYTLLEYPLEPPRAPGAGGKSSPEEPRSAIAPDEARLVLIVPD